MNEFGYSPLHITKIMMAAIYIYIISTYRVSYMDECVSTTYKVNFFYVQGSTSNSSGGSGMTKSDPLALKDALTKSKSWSESSQT